MVIAFFIFGMFLGFSLGIAAMALVGARHYRIACEDEEAAGQKRHVGGDQLLGRRGAEAAEVLLLNAGDLLP